MSRIQIKLIVRMVRLVGQTEHSATSDSKFDSKINLIYIYFMSESTKEQAEAPKPLNYGIKPDKLAQVIGRVAELYTDISGRQLNTPMHKHFLDPNIILSALEEDRAVEYRWGSTLNNNSKLHIEIVMGGLIKFRFDANLMGDVNKKEGISREERFNAEINKYLLESGLGEPLPDFLQ